MSLITDGITMNEKQRRPTVLITTPIYEPLNGGASTYFVSLVQSLINDVDFIILTTHVKNTRVFEFDSRKKIFRIIPNMLSWHIPIRYFMIPIILVNILAIMLLYKPNVIHAHASATFGFSSGLASKLYRVKIIKDVQDMGIVNFNIKLGDITRYIATGTTVGKILKSLDIPDDKIITFPSLNPVECKNIYNRLCTTNSFVHTNKINLLFVGTLSRSVKGIDILIASFEKLSEILPDIELTIIGDGPDKDWCKDQIKVMDLNEIVHMTGSLTYGDTLAYMAKCDMLILPSRSEANPRVILEAFQFCKPVIATDVGGVSDILKNEYNGLLIQANNSNQLFQAIERLAVDSNLRNTLGKNGQRFVESLPKCSELHNKILTIYQQSLK